MASSTKNNGSVRKLPLGFLAQSGAEEGDSPFWDGESWVPDAGGGGGGPVAAPDVSFDPGASTLISTDVEAAILEVDTKVEAVESDVSDIQADYVVAADISDFVVSADIADFVTSDGSITNIVSLTQAAYDLLDPVDPNTLYLVTA